MAAFTPSNSISVGFLRAALAEYPDDFTLDFSGLTFHRVKQRSPTHLQIEFGEIITISGPGHGATAHDPG